MLTLGVTYFTWYVCPISTQAVRHTHEGSFHTKSAKKSRIFMKFGTDMDSTKKLSPTKFGWFYWSPFKIWPLNFKNITLAHMFNKMAITVTNCHRTVWIFGMLIKFFFRWYIITQKKRSNHKDVTFHLMLIFFKKNELLLFYVQILL